MTSGTVTLDLALDGLYVTQATQDFPDAAVPLVKDRSAYVRVFVTANQSNTVAPQVQVQFTLGNASNTITIPAPSSSVPTSADPNTNTAWSASIPSSWIQDGTQVTATVDPSGLIAEADKKNNSASQTLDVRTMQPWKITLIPIATGDGNTGTVVTSGRTLNDWVDFARRLYPVPDAVDVQQGLTLTVSTVNTLQSSGTGWDTVLQALAAKRTTDGVTNRYYYGVVHVNYQSGVAGLGYVGAPEAIGWDANGAPSVLAHEEGHNFGRQHSPCGNPDSPDPNYPYPGGLIGVPGWDAFASSNNLQTKNHTDIMGYCSNQWISDYTYQGVLSFRSAHSQAMMESSVHIQGEEGLLVWGEIENGHVTLQPAFRVPVTSAFAEYGPYQLEARDATGQVIATMSFDSSEIADLPGRNIRAYSFVVPIAADKIASVQSLHILKDGQELARTQRSVMGTQVLKQTQPVSAQDLPDRRTSLTWDAARYPMIMVKDARTGEVRGFLRGGTATVVDAPDEMELHVSDGVTSDNILHQRTQP